MPMIFEGHNETDAPMDIVGSHQRCLVAAAMRTEGLIVELGVGWYSTPILHEIATVHKRKFVTFDNNAHWLKQFLRLENEWHSLKLLGWWGDMSLEEHYGLVFVDQGQPIEREYSIRRMMDRTDVFVMHDTEEGFAYGYERTLPMFKYVYTDKSQIAWTSIASNTVDVRSWIINLPPELEPKPEVT